MSDADDPGKPPPPPPSAEHRGSYRAPIRLRVDYERMNTFFADYTKNISKGGTFIKTARPLSIGTKFAFNMSVPAYTEPMTLQGVVAWIVEPDEAERTGGEAGMGIRFIFESEAEQLKLEALVEKMMVDSLGREMADKLLKGG